MLDDSPQGAIIPVTNSLQRNDNPERSWQGKQIFKTTAMSNTSTKRKRLNDNAYHIIRNDIPLRHKIAKALDIESESVYVAARRKSTRFSLPFVLEIITKHTGNHKDEILEINQN